MQTRRNEPAVRPAVRITKNRQPVQALRAMVARAYGPEELCDAGENWVSELSDGWFNVAYRIRLRSGAQVVLAPIRAMRCATPTTSS